MDIAKTLINMSLDMDYADYKETITTEYQMVSRQIESLKDTPLYYVLESIAHDNKDVTDLLTEMMEEN